MNIFTLDDPVDPDKINENFEEVGSKEFTLGENLSAGDVIRIVDDAGEAKAYSIFESLTQSIGVLTSNGGNTLQSVDATYDPINKVIIAVYTRSNYNCAILGVPGIDGTITWGNESMLSSTTGALGAPKIFYDSLNKKIITVYHRDDTYYDAICILKVNKSYLSLSKIGEITLGTSYNYYAFLEDVAGKFIIAYGKNTIYTRTVSVSGDTLTLNAEIHKSLPNIMSGLSAFKNGNKVYLYYGYYDSYKYYNIVESVTVSGDTLTFDNNGLSYDNATERSPRAIGIAGTKLVIFYTESSICKHIFITDTNGVLAYSGSAIVDTPTLSNTSYCDIQIKGLAIEICYQDSAGSDSYFMAGVLGDGVIAWNDAIKIYDNVYVYKPVFIPFLSKYLFFQTSSYYYVLAQIAGSYPTKINDACGILQTSGVAGEVKPVAMNYNLSKVHSGHTINANAYIDESTGKVTESASSYPIGVFTSPTDLFYYRLPVASGKYLGKFYQSLCSAGSELYQDITIPLGFRAKKVTLLGYITFGSNYTSETNIYLGPNVHPYPEYYWVDGTYFGMSDINSSFTDTGDYLMYRSPSSGYYAHLKVQEVTDTYIKLRMTYKTSTSGNTYGYANCKAVFIIE